MATRTHQRTVTFTKPFHLTWMDGLLPPGEYRVDTDEESVDGLSFVVWRHTATTIRVSRNGVTQVFRVDPTDLEASLMRDAGHTISSPSPARP